MDNKFDLVRLVVDILVGCLFLAGKGTEYIVRNLRFLRSGERRTLFELAQAAFGMTLVMILIALGGVVLFIETCVPFDLNLGR